jgi:hypothetical protein
MCVYILENVHTLAVFVRKPLTVQVISANICVYTVGYGLTLVTFVRNPFTAAVI